ncbi:MAG: class I SAM-dependent methyltransferase [Wenzhouxiangella sp.]
MNNDWYLDEDFWRTFGPLMFNEETFAGAEEEVRQLLELLPSPPDTVLDLGAGPGRHSLPLARSGYTVTAVDTSAGLLEQLGQSAGDLGIETVRADMREFVREAAFDLVLVMWTTVGYFEDEADHERVLDNIRASLRPGGRLVLDLVGLEYLCRHLEPVHLTEYEDGRMLVERPVLVDEMRRIENEWLLIDGDRVERADFSHRVWSAGEITRILAERDFAVERVCGDYDGADYDLDARRLIVIASPVS